MTERKYREEKEQQQTSLCIALVLATISKH